MKRLGELTVTEIENRIRDNWLNLFDTQLQLHPGMNATALCKAAGISYTAYGRVCNTGAPVGQKLMIDLARYANLDGLGYFSQETWRAPIVPPSERPRKKPGPRVPFIGGMGSGWKTTA